MLTAPFTEAARRPGRPAAEPVLAKLSALAPLTPPETALVRRIAAQREMHPAGAEIYGEGANLRPRVLLSGWACRMRMLPDGRRQIFAFLLPGDAVGLSTRPQPPGQCTVVALTRVETADATALRDAVAADCAGASGLGLACALALALEEGQVLDHVTRLGRQSALERTAHLLLELHDRLTCVGLADGARFSLPLTQEVLADALGLSIVHINRTLQQLKRDGLIEMKAGWVRLLDPERLAGRADFAAPPRAGALRRSFAPAKSVSAEARA
jgi:CRP-like cAMP-binding protein